MHSHLCTASLSPGEQRSQLASSEHAPCHRAAAGSAPRMQVDSPEFYHRQLNQPQLVCRRMHVLMEFTWLIMVNAKN